MHPHEFSIYPIVDSFSWVEKLLPFGIRLIQLRIKDRNRSGLAEEIRDAIRLAEEYDAKLFINDHWRHAIEWGAWGVHLGQDDLDPTALMELRKAGVRLGVSTHNLAEIENALQHDPSYIAIGTVFQSPSKKLNYTPLAVEGFRELRELTNLPVVAIGGVTLERAPDLLEAGADGLAVISSITHAVDLPRRIADWLNLFERYHND